MKLIKKLLPKILITINSFLILIIGLYLVLLSLNYFGLFEFGQIGRNSGILLSTFLMILISKGSLLVGLVLLSLILKGINKKEPFKSETIKKFYLAGLIMLIVPVLNSMSTFLIVNNKDLSLLMAESLIGKLTTYLVLSILILAFAHVLNQGLRIYEEQKLTV